MAMASSLTLSLLLITLIFTPTTTQSAPSISTTSPLDPDQITALRSLNLPTKPDPCSSSHNNAAAVVKCDSSSPFRHVTFLSLSNLTLSLSPLKSLRHSLSSLSLSLCHVTPRRRPLTGVFLATFSNLTHLSVTTSPINASGPTVILHGMKNLQTVRISDANLTGVLPKKWRSVNLTAVDFSRNRLRGRIPSSISSLESLESLDLSGNGLDGEIPSSVGDLVSLKNLSLSSNSISGSLPKDLPVGLERLDLGSNQFNGTIPHFISSMKSLKYLNLEKNNFEGVMPFNASFIKKLEVFKIGGNSNLCYNHSKFSTKVKLGIAPCDKHGLPLSPPPPKDDGGDDSGDDYSPDDGSPKKKSSSHGPNKVVLGVAIGLSAVVFLIIFCVLISKCCR